MFEGKEKHESYGMLQFSRMTSSHGRPLFGSSIQHKDTIIMTLKEGEVLRHLNNDYYFGSKEIVQVEMSYSQFAEVITAMNIGTGVPVTINYIQGKGSMEKCPFVDKKQQYEEEFAEHLEDIKKDANDIIREVKEIFEKKSIGKGDKEEILKKLQRLETQIGSNTEFIYKQFNEQMEKTVTESKGEIEAFCQNKLNSIALAALSEHHEVFGKLENPIDARLDDKKEQKYD